MPDLKSERLQFLRSAGALLVAVACVAGCVLPPEKSQPERSWTAPAEFDQPAGTDTGLVSRTAPLSNMPWQQYFTDSQLQALINKALQHNRDLRATAARVMQAQKAYGIQYAVGLPQINAGAGANRAGLTDNSAFFGIPAVNSGYQVGLSMVSWELDFWGRVQDLRDSAMQQFLSADANRRAATLSLIAQVAQTYIGLGRSDEQIELARAQVLNREESLRFTQRRVDTGAAAPVELTTAQLLLNQAKTTLVALQQGRAEQWQAMNLLVGGGMTSLSKITLSTQAWPEVPAGVPSDLLKSRPDIMAAEHQLQAMQANVSAARAAFFPRITLTALGGVSSNQFSQLFDGGNGTWMFSPQISLPIFDGGARQSNHELQTWRRTESLAQYEKAIQAAFREVNDALSNTHWLKQRLELSTADRVQQQERARVAKSRFQAGSTPYQDVLEAQRDQLQVEQALIQARGAWISSRINLYAALGGGSALLANTVSTSVSPTAH
jgi:multidrug efflux system outer membrane protein